jgi:hypothetical protein
VRTVKVSTAPGFGQYVANAALTGPRGATGVRILRAYATLKAAYPPGDRLEALQRARKIALRQSVVR